MFAASPKQISTLRRCLLFTENYCILTVPFWRRVLTGVRLAAGTFTKVKNTNVKVRPDISIEISRMECL